MDEEEPGAPPPPRQHIQLWWGGCWLLCHCRDVPGCGRYVGGWRHKAIVYTSRFVRVILVQGPCESSLYRSNFNGLSPKGIQHCNRQQWLA